VAGCRQERRGARERRLHLPCREGALRGRRTLLVPRQRGSDGSGFLNNLDISFWTLDILKIIDDAVVLSLQKEFSFNECNQTIIQITVSSGITAFLSTTVIPERM
jgi:hypothetical protein